MAQNIPTVFVSSTCYDLRQIRADLSIFLEKELGYRGLLSEQNSFPIDPDLDTIENCRRRVEQDADILVLIIGGRYGSVDQNTAKSITNLEYLTARSIGIPIYAFIESSILSIMPVWEKNKDADFTGTVDNTKLFEFIEEIRGRDKVWTHSFTTAQDITTSLRNQFAHLMMDGLQWRSQVLGGKPEELIGLSGKALRFAVEKPKAWEHRLFAQVLIDSVADSDSLLREYNLGLSFGRGEHISDDQTTTWLRHRIKDMTVIVGGLTPLIDSELVRAVGAPGEAGDVKSIVFVGRKIGFLYREALEWAIAVRRANVEEIWMPVTKTMAKFCDSIITPISSFGHQFLAAIDDALANPSAGVKVVEMDLKVGPFDPDPYIEELEKISRMRGYM